MALRFILHQNYFINLTKCLFINQNKINCTLNRSIHLSPFQLKRVAFHLSDIGEGIREVIVKEWFVKEGDVVEQFENLCEVQSDKASVTITSRYDGKILKLYHNVDDTALVGKPLIDFDVIDDNTVDAETKGERNHVVESESNELISNKKVDETQAEMIEKNSNRYKALATPAVRRIANENQVNLNDVTATGRLGRVLKSDILEHLNVIPPSVESNKTKVIVEKQELVSKSSKVSTSSAVASDRIEKLKDVRKIMYKTMTLSLKIPHFTYSDEVDVTELVKVREQLKLLTQSQGIKLSFMPFFIKAASLALTKYPILNSSMDEATESIIYKSTHNISIAMAAPNGLVVPNIKNCEQKSIIDIARDLNTLQQKGQTFQLAPDDFANGTFSLSNIGVVGGTYTKPCIVSPQVSIGAIGTTKIVPRFDENDNICKVHLIHVSWSADHRVIDGVTMASFSNEWKNYVEQPIRFLLQ